MPKRDKSEEELTHSGVVPYRIRNGKAEVLLVTASGSGRWVVPKGHIVEEVGSRESARREAFEEAGIEGTVEATAFDRYIHGDDDMVVEVFLMHITSEAASWPEEGVRQRRWVSFQEADGLVQDPGLRKLLRKASASPMIASGKATTASSAKGKWGAGIAVAAVLIAAVVLAGNVRSDGGKKSGKDERNVAAASSTKEQNQGVAGACVLGGQTASLPADLPEASGVAASATQPGILWTHNDSGEPFVYAVDRNGNNKGRVRLTGAKVQDWESIDLGTCPGGQCLYIGDIGDNNATRQEIVVYRVPEPAANAGTSAPVEAFRARYPDGAHDAEALFVDSRGIIHIVTKGETGPIGVYRFPSNGSSGVSTMEKVRSIADGKITKNERITDADMSADGKWIVLRTSRDLLFYLASDFAGSSEPQKTMNLKSLKEPQGEGVSFGPTSATVVLTGEGGKKDKPGTVTELACTL